MVGAGAHKGQSEGDIDPLLHTQIFDGNQPLVVVHGHHHINGIGLATLSARAHENGIGRPWPTHNHPFRFGNFYGRLDDVHLFAPQQTTLTCMRVKSCHCKMRRTPCKSQFSAMGDAQCLQNDVHRDGVNRLAQRLVDGDQDGFELSIGQHHAHWQLICRFV